MTVLWIYIPVDPALYWLLSWQFLYSLKKVVKWWNFGVRRSLYHYEAVVVVFEPCERWRTARNDFIFQTISKYANWNLWTGMNYYLQKTVLFNFNTVCQISALRSICLCFYTVCGPLIEKHCFCLCFLIPEMRN